MDITFKGKIPYGDLDIGDVFICDGKVFMQTDVPEEGTNDEYKSVNLSNGEMEIFGRLVMVRKIECELIINA